jgi:hypothetical protein
MPVLGSVPGGWTAAAGDSFVPQDRLFLRQDDGQVAGVITSEERSCVANSWRLEYSGSRAAILL